MTSEVEVQIAHLTGHGLTPTVEGHQRPQVQPAHVLEGLGQRVPFACGGDVNLQVGFGEIVP